MQWVIWPTSSSFQKKKKLKLGTVAYAYFGPIFKITKAKQAGDVVQAIDCFASAKP
jgi:hypothetical protein